MIDSSESAAAAPTTSPAMDPPNPQSQAQPGDVAAPTPPKNDEIQKSAALNKDTMTDKSTSPNKDAATVSPAPPTPLAKLFGELNAIIKDADYKEMWGFELQDDKHVITTIILQKFLRANNNNVEKAKKQLGDALKWRKRMQPSALIDNVFDRSKFGGLGFVTMYDLAGKSGKEIITWNIYGAVKDIKNTFGDVEA